jgi:hypothetical protein
MELHRPDVLVLHKVLTVSGWLAEWGIRVPEDLSLFCINVPSSKWSGLIRNYQDTGRSAVDMVGQMLRNGENGLPRRARTLHVEGAWQPGTTLRLPIAKFIDPDGALRSESPRMQDLPLSMTERGYDERDPRPNAVAGTGSGVLKGSSVTIQSGSGNA